MTARTEPASSTDVFVRLLPYLRVHGRSIALGLSCLLLTTPAGSFHPLVWGFMVDTVIGRRRVDLLLPALGVMLCVQALGTALEAVRDNLLQKVGQRLVRDLRNDVYAKLQRQSIGFHHDSRAGDLLSRAMMDVDVLQEVAVQGTDSVVSNLLSFVFVAGVLITLNWRLGCLTLLPIVLVFGLTRRFNARVKSLYTEARERLGDLSARLQETLAGMVVIKGFAMEAREMQRFHEAAERYLAANFRAINARTTFFPAVRFVGFFSNLLSLGVGSWMVLHGQFTLGGLIAYRGYWWPLFAPINSLATVNEMLQRARAAGARVFALLDGAEAVRDAPGATALAISHGRVAFEDVTFRYRRAGADGGEARDATLNGVSFVAQPGEMIAVVGPSGAGKTTVLNLLARFWDPDDGRILIDGSAIDGVTQASLRGQMAIVQQETLLFNGTVLENLTYGRPDAAMAEVERAVAAANATDFIAEMPAGYATEIGERGVRLSGGQRQRLAIARAFLADPRILVLDEPISSVEPESEWVITCALERLMEGRTTFLTSHRLSIVRRAHRIVVLDAGSVVETGTHADLLAAGGLYAAMYRRQMTDTTLDAQA